MTEIAPYLKVLNHLNKSEGLQLRAHTDGRSLWIEEIPFTKAPPSALFQADFSAKGVLSPKLTPREKEFCHTYAISYLTTDGSLYLVRKRSVLSVEPKKPSHRSKREKPLAPSWLRTGGQGSPQKPTHLISPNAFAILDVLFGLTEQELREFSSGLQFAKKYGLYQPKLSTLMTAMGSRNLIELRHRVSGLSTEWWVSALRYPATRRVFTPFFAHAKPYHSTAGQPDELQHEKLRSMILSAERDQIAPGPTEVAKECGLLRDQDHTVWGTPSALQALKKELRLVPGSERGSPTWFLATPLHGLQREAILSNLSEPRRGGRSNVLRAIWDLSYGDSRLAEVQVEMLQRVFK